jgi:hypothetical protein
MSDKVSDYIICQPLLHILFVNNGVGKFLAGAVGQRGFHAYKIQSGMLQRTQMLQGTRSNTIGRRSTRVRLTYRAFPLN